MRFAEVPKTLLFSAVVSDFLDYAFTLAGYSRFSPLLETNQYILFVTQFVSPELAVTIVFSFTLAAVIASYFLGVRRILLSEPYDGTLRKVARYLGGSRVMGRDLLLFSVLVMYALFIHMHLAGAVYWLRLLS